MKRARSGLAAAAGAPDLLLLVGEDNLPAIKLYAKMGFEKWSSPSWKGTCRRSGAPGASGGC